jgi:flagellar biosynthesis activator protein FlaF
MTLKAYLRVQSIAETPRAMERRLLALVTGKLVAAREQNWTGAALVDVLHHNREMWQTFAAMCGTEGNGLPDELRAGIISLALWVDRHSSDVATGREPLDALINVNRMIGEGLGIDVAEAA